MIEQSNILKEPKSLDEILYHTRLINRLKGYIQKEKYPAALFFCGPPGTGKTATVKNFIRTVRCINRDIYSTEPCGKCRVCQSDPTLAEGNSNVMWIQQGRTQNVSQQIKEITDFCFQPPEFAALQGDKEHTNRKFVVIDELQNLSEPQISKLLYLSESPKLDENKVILIFITMEEERLNEVTRNALVSRTKRFFFSPPNEEQVTNFLTYNFGEEYSKESLDLISWECNRNLRMALTLMDCCLEDDPNLSPISVAETLNFANLSKRIELWELLMGVFGKGKQLYFQIDNYTQKLLRYNIIEKNLIKQLIEDVKYCLINQEDNTAEKDQLLALKELTDYLSDSCPVPLTTFFVLFAKKGLKPIDLDLLKHRYSKQSGYDKLKQEYQE